jgi:hypothetical protein
MIGGKVEEAYRRGDMLAFCSKPMTAAEVIPLRAASIVAMAASRASI